jgi:hypothetical protein
MRAREGGTSRAAAPSSLALALLGCAQVIGGDFGDYTLGRGGGTSIDGAIHESGGAGTGDTGGTRSTGGEAATGGRGSGGRGGASTAGAGGAITAGAGGVFTAGVGGVNTGGTNTSTGGVVNVDECATNNGGCGPPLYWTCIDNVGAPPTCLDIDECDTNNGGCGDVASWMCTNNPGSAPSCAPRTLGYIGSSFGSVNGVSPMAIPLPAGTTASSTLYLLVVYENSAAVRPPISGFTALTSGNGGTSAPNNAGPVSTWIVYKGTAVDPVVIPTDSTLGGVQATCAAFSGVLAETTTVLGASGTTAPTDTITKTSTQTVLVLGAYDVGNAVAVPAISLTGFTSASTYATPEGAVPGRAGFVGVISSTATSVLPTYPAPPETGYYLVRLLVD